MAVCKQGQNIRFFNIFYLYFSLKGSAISDVEAQEHYDKFFEVCTHTWMLFWLLWCSNIAHRKRKPNFVFLFCAGCISWVGGESKWLFTCSFCVL